MLFSVTVLPISGGDTIADPVADVVQRIEDAGLPYEVNGTSTVIEAEWDDVMPLLRAAESELQRRYKRVFMLITIDDHVGGTGRLRGAVADIDEQVNHILPLRDAPCAHGFTHTDETYSGLNAGAHC
jgi:uncharacterized protein YqgV (UPF0045/DUF77 family)